MDLARPVLAAHMIAMHFNSDGLHLKCANRVVVMMTQMSVNFWVVNVAIY